MLDNIPKIPAIEKFGKNNRSPLNPSPLLESDIDNDSNPTSIFKNTTSAVAALEKRNTLKSNSISGIVKQLEKIGALSPAEPTASQLKNEFAQVSTNLKKTCAVLDNTHQNFILWAETFESEEINELAKEFSKFLGLQKAMSDRFVERLDHISSRLKPVTKLESQRNKSLNKYIKSKKAYSDFKNKSTDQHTLSTLELQKQADFGKVLNDQALVEKSIRSNLRPSLFAYAYCMKQTKEAIEFLLKNTELNIDDFEKIIQNEDSTYEASLNLSKINLVEGTSEYINKKGTFYNSDQRDVYGALHEESMSSLNSSDGNETYFKDHYNNLNQYKLEKKTNKTRCNNNSVVVDKEDLDSDCDFKANESSDDIFFTYKTPMQLSDQYDIEYNKANTTLTSPLVQPVKGSKFPNYTIVKNHNSEDNATMKAPCMYKKNIPNETNNFESNENLTYVAKSVEAKPPPLKQAIQFAKGSFDAWRP